MEDKNVREILDRIALPANNNLLEELKWRQANRAWLRKSQAIAIKILSTLKIQGISQKDLAEKMGVTPQMVSKILKGSENLTLETISKVETALGIHLVETAETLKAKISQYEANIYGYSKTLKYNVNIVEQRTQSLETKNENVCYTNIQLVHHNTKTYTKDESNLKEEETKYAIAS